MTIQMLKLKGERYVLLREKDYRALSRKAAESKPRRTPRLTAQDMGDIAEVQRRKARGPARPYAELRKKLGLA